MLYREFNYMNSKIERYLIKCIEFIVLNDNFYRKTIILVFLIFNLDIYNIINNNIKNNFLFSYACICYEYITTKIMSIE